MLSFKKFLLEQKVTMDIMPIEGGGPDNVAEPQTSSPNVTNKPLSNNKPVNDPTQTDILQMLENLRRWHEGLRLLVRDLESCYNYPGSCDQEYIDRLNNSIAEHERNIRNLQLRINKHINNLENESGVDIHPSYYYGPYGIFMNSPVGPFEWEASDNITPNP